MKTLMIGRRLASAGVGLLSLGLLLGHSASALAQEPTLAGAWRYDQEKSAQERKAASGTPQVGQGMNRNRNRGNAGATDVASSGGGGAGRIAPREGAQAGGGGMDFGPMAPFARSPRQLEIVHSDSTVMISDPAGMSQVYFLDGRKERAEIPGADPIEVMARWKGGKLTIERKFGSRGSVREVYSLRADGKEMLVEVRITGAEIAQPVDQKRVYELTPPKN